MSRNDRRPNRATPETCVLPRVGIVIRVPLRQRSPDPTLQATRRWPIRSTAPGSSCADEFDNFPQVGQRVSVIRTCQAIRESCPEPPRVGARGPLPRRPCCVPEPPLIPACLVPVRQPTGSPVRRVRSRGCRWAIAALISWSVFISERSGPKVQVAEHQEHTVFTKILVS